MVARGIGGANVQVMELNMTSTFYAQKYYWENERLQLSDPQQFNAQTHDEAAEIAYGKGLLPSGHARNLAAKIWRIAGFKPEIRLYYRPATSN